MLKPLLTLIGTFFILNTFGQGSFITAESMLENTNYSGTVTDNNNGPVNIPFHYYKTSISGNGIIRIISTITNTSSTSAGSILLKVYFKDKVLYNTKPVTINANTTVTDTFMVTGVEQDSIYILFENSGVVYGGPFNYTTHYNLLNVFPNTENEPNNSFSQAQTLHQGDAVSGHISYRSDGYYLDEKDYYRLIFSDNGTVNLYFSWTNLCIAPGFVIPAPTVYGYGRDTSVTVLLDHTSGPYGPAMNIANSGNTPFTSTIYDTLQIYGRAHDTLYIYMYNFFSGWGIAYSGSYTLNFDMSDIGIENEVNPNNDIAHAQHITPFNAIQGLIGYYNGVNNVDQNDYYQITSTPGDSIKIYITAENKYKYNPIAVNPSVFAYDKNGNNLTIYSATGASSAGGLFPRSVYQQPFDVPISDTMSINALPTDTIYLRIYNYDASFIYQFHYTSALTAINENGVSDFMNIYPVPASDKINITFNAKVDGITQLDLYALNGKKITSLYVGNASEDQHLILPLPKLADGLYLIAMKTGDGKINFQKIAVLRGN